MNEVYMCFQFVEMFSLLEILDGHRACYYLALQASEEGMHLVQTVNARPRALRTHTPCSNHAYTIQDVQEECGCPTSESLHVCL